MILSGKGGPTCGTANAVKCISPTSFLMNSHQPMDISTSVGQINLVVNSRSAHGSSNQHIKYGYTLLKWDLYNMIGGSHSRLKAIQN